MQVSVNFDNIYKVKDETDIGTIKVLMLKGETGSANVSDAAGILAIEHGGTGAAAADAARTNLGLAVATISDVLGLFG